MTAHGLGGALTFELEGRAELCVLSDQKLERLLAAGGHRTKLIFCAACDSERAGHALARAGVPHVVCVRGGVRLGDRVARDFAEQFYAALLRGQTVRSAFDVASAVDESSAYLLLPKRGDHDAPLSETAAPGGLEDESPTPCLAPGPSPPAGMAGRESAVAEIVRLVGFERRRCVTIRGPKGAGKTAVARAAAQFLADRRGVGAVVEVKLGDVAEPSYFSGLSPGRTDRNVERAFIGAARRVAMRVGVSATADDVESVFAAIARVLAHQRLLVLVDGVDAKRHRGVVRAISRLLAAVPSASILATGTTELHAGDDRVEGEPEKIFELGPLDDRHMAQLLADLAPRRLASAEMRGDDDDSALSPAGVPDRPFSPLPRDARDPTALAGLARHPAVAALHGNPGAAVRFAPELRRPLRQKSLLVAAARAAAADADAVDAVTSSWDWACTGGGNV